jgi:DNA polymerase elongation subunit (family B)
MPHLLDIEYRDGYIILWVMDGGRCTSHRHRYYPRIYLECPIHNRHLVASLPQVQHVHVEQKSTDLGKEPKDLLALSLKDWGEAYSLADMLEQRGWKAYNVDLSPARQYLLERGLFPMARLDPKLCLDDEQQSMDYSLPDITTLTLQVVPGTDRNPCFSDPIREIHAGENVLDGREGEMIQNLTTLVRQLDPDVILTNGGDSFQLPYLYHRAQETGTELQLGREKDDPPPQKKGRSYFSYGRIIYKPGGHSLRGRLHIDTQTFIFREGGMRGLIDLGRITGIPMQQLSRLSPGSAVTALQVTQALKDGVLVPWRRNLSENFKTAEELLRSDRGALILEPRVGIYENVAEMDFTSLFPHIMATKNISPETVLCECCPDSPQRVPFIRYNICQRRIGLIPRVIGPLVERRMTYKKWGKDNEEYRAVQNVLKWLLVTSFGYMGFNKARFGRIECHESITAYAREILLQTMELAEGMGFEILHGIVDSLWVTGNADPRILCDRVSETVGIPLELKGHYHWIVFPSNRLNRAGALNRYFGLMTDGNLKVRGIELRRRDTPEFIRKLQQDMLERMKAAHTVDELYAALPCVRDVVRRYAGEILNGEVIPDELVFTTHTRHKLEEYRQKGSQAAALYQLREEGVDVQPGQAVQYVHTDSRSRYYHERVKVAELMDSDTEYDREKYYQIMLRAAESILRPFGYDREVLNNVVMGSEQMRMEDFIKLYSN